MIATEDIKILKLHVRDGSFVSKNTVCISASTSSKEIIKIKSDSEGIIKLLCSISDQKEKNSQLFSLTQCDHSVKFADLCGMCGKTIPKENSQIFNQTIPKDRYAICHGNKNTCVSEEMAMEYSLQDNISLLKKRKLVLLVDLDLTILQTTTQNPSVYNIPDVFEYKLRDDLNRPMANKHYTRLRPGCQQFLEEMHELFQMQIYTFGNRSYAKKMQEKIDPTKKLFVNRITSRDDSFDLRKKTENLKSLFPRGDNLVCIIDDRTEVWNDVSNLVHVKPYIVFPDVGDINNPFIPNASTSNNSNNNETTEEVDKKENEDKDNGNKVEFIDHDDYLKHLTRILRTIHEKYFEEYDKIYSELKSETVIIQSKRLPHIRDIMSNLRSQILAGCRVAMSGLVRHDKSIETNDCVKILRKMGGVYQEKVHLPQLPKVKNNKSEDGCDLGSSCDRSICQTNKPYTTHLISSIENTEKIKQTSYYIKGINKLITKHQSLLPHAVHKVYLVHQEWLWKSYFLWKRAQESECSFKSDIELLPLPEGHVELIYEKSFDDKSSKRKTKKKRSTNSDDENNAKRPRLSPSSNEDLNMENYNEESNESNGSSDDSSIDSNLDSDELEKELDLIDNNLMLNYSIDDQNNIMQEIDEAIYEDNENIKRNSLSPGIITDKDDEDDSSNSDSTKNDSSVEESKEQNISDDEEALENAQYKEGLKYMGLDLSSDSEGSEI